MEMAPVLIHRSGNLHEAAAMFNSLVVAHAPRTRSPAIQSLRTGKPIGGDASIYQPLVTAQNEGGSRSLHLATTAPL